MIRRLSSPISQMLPMQATSYRFPETPILHTRPSECYFTGNARVELPVKPLWQGYTNGCGTTSLAMALNCLAEMKGHRGSVTQEQLDQKRPFDIYTAPGILVQLAKAQGYCAQQYNRSSFQEIKAHIDQGHVIIALHNAVGTEGKPGPLHYFVIHGYQDGPDITKQKLMIVDPGRENENKAKFELTYQDLCKYWKRPKLGCLPIGVHRFMVAVSAKNDFPAKSRHRLPVTIQLANLFHSLTNWYAKSWLRPIGTALYSLLTLPAKIWKWLKSGRS